MTLPINPELKEWYAKHHETPSKRGAEYGATGARNAGPEIMRSLDGRKRIKTVLDFGAGKGTLKDYIDKTMPGRFDITNYDPCIPGIDKLPEGAVFDAIISSDVLEHVEPDDLAATIDWMYDHVDQTMCHYIACFPTHGKMADGRDLHLIVEKPIWWKELFKNDPRWIVTEYRPVTLLKRRVERDAVYLVVDKVKSP